MAEKDQVELEEKIIDVRRCAKVRKGGRRFSFSVCVVVGDRRGRVGIGSSSAPEIADARNKAAHQAKKRMVRVYLKHGRTIHHDHSAKACAGAVIMKSAPPGTGIIAGGSARALLELAGITDIVVKSEGSTNARNLLYAVMEGLTTVSNPRFIAEKRGKKISDIVRKGRVKTEAPATLAV